jgi:thiol-disulfide isomerase/thioredoxin
MLARVRIRVLVAATLAGAALLAGCGEESTSGTETATPSASSPSSLPATAPSTPPAAAAALAQPPVSAQLQFTATTLDGQTFDGATLSGRPAVLWFWAPWCPVCRQEAPLIAELAAEYDGRVAFVGIAGLSSDRAAMQEFVDDGGVGAIPHIDDINGDVYARFGVASQYDIGFVDSAGNVRIVPGPLSEAALRDEVAGIAGT